MFQIQWVPKPCDSPHRLILKLLVPGLMAVDQEWSIAERRTATVEKKEPGMRIKRPVCACLPLSIPKVTVGQVLVVLNTIAQCPSATANQEILKKN